MPETKCGFDSSPGVSGSVLLIAQGPTIFVDIGFDPSYKADERPLKIPVPSIRGIKALIDTGATESCIDSMLAAQLNLPIVDRRTVSGVHGSLEVNLHLAQVHFPALGCTLYGAFAGVHLAAGGQSHQALIGRTFLCNYTMVYEGRTGTVTLSA